MLFELGDPITSLGERLNILSIPLGISVSVETVVTCQFHACERQGGLELVQLFALFPFCFGYKISHFIIEFDKLLRIEESFFRFSDTVVKSELLSGLGVVF